MFWNQKVHGIHVSELVSLCWAAAPCGIDVLSFTKLLDWLLHWMCDWLTDLAGLAGVAGWAGWAGYGWLDLLRLLVAGWLAERRMKEGRLTGLTLKSAADSPKDPHHGPLFFPLPALQSRGGPIPSRLPWVIELSSQWPRGRSLVDLW